MTEMTDRTRDAGSDPGVQPGAHPTGETARRLPVTRQPSAPRERQRHQHGEYWDLDRCAWVPWPTTD